MSTLTEHLASLSGYGRVLVTSACIGTSCLIAFAMGWFTRTAPKEER